MSPRQRAPNRSPGKPIVLPFINEDFARRRQERIVAKLVDENFCGHNGQRHDVAEPERVRTVHEINQNSVHRPRRNREGEVAKILHARFSLLEKRDQKKLGQNRARQNGGDDDEREPVRMLQFRQRFERRRRARTAIIREQNREHQRLQN